MINLQGISEELYVRSNQDWQKVFSEFPGWKRSQDPYEFVREGKAFFLVARLGRWEGSVEMRADGMYEGAWISNSTNPRLRASGIGAEQFTFTSQSNLTELLDTMEKWIEVRRSPKTWRGAMSLENESVLQGAQQAR